MASKVICELVEGPLDGVQLGLRRRPSYLWVDRRRGHTARVLPGPIGDWVLYRLVGRNYLYAGNTHVLCPGCSGYVETLDGHNAECDFCGSVLAVSTSQRQI